MSIGLILLAIASVLVLFGVAQRVLDKMQLSDRAALIIAAVIFFGGLIPNIRVGSVSVNIGGAIAPLGVCVWLLAKTDTAKEFWRAIIGSVLTAAVVFFLGRVMPNEPESIVMDPNYVYGLVGGAVAYALGRSRRAAFICGVMGVVLCLLLLIPGNMLIHHIAGDVNVVASLPPQAALTLIVLATLLTMLGGLIPARSAAKSNPVKALRSE